MLSHARIMFRKLRGSGSRSSRGSDPAPSALATTAESETINSSPRAIHISDVRRSPTRLLRKPGSDSQSMSIIVANAKGAADSSHLYRLLQREKDYGEFDPTDEFDIDYFCEGYVYNVCFIPPSAPGPGLAYLCLMQHVCLVFTYDASSRESWDEMVAAYERIRSRYEDRVLPFLTTIIAAMGEGEVPVSHVEAEAFATQRDCLFFKFSPTTGRGICDAVGSLIELAHGARDQYAMDQEGYTQRYKRAEAVQALFPS
ncbi:uncharacterized protein N7446_014008 [Penicillium canescens]|uniref:Uncharacterized protein n=1 Tax=Penicillium canescens TaxID=5083 RepID=A0AAD6HZX8_PENCN|nr:uncharacterized protein N7446_014008 [Penicillium canescens]KAJ6023643.1 hypothetical protein N7460_014038 [Penicillium canescens]KAJ6025080.1 hypothetical protein N7444_012759 [Penicillium canescens]KAJ6042942.1 hypothetical protein N7446_014008 [Penicillium canescens]